MLGLHLESAVLLQDGVVTLLDTAEEDVSLRSEHVMGWQTTSLLTELVEPMAKLVSDLRLAIVALSLDGAEARVTTALLAVNLHSEHAALFLPRLLSQRRQLHPAMLVPTDHVAGQRRKSVLEVLSAIVAALQAGAEPRLITVQPDVNLPLASVVRFQRLRAQLPRLLAMYRQMERVVVQERKPA